MKFFWAIVSLFVVLPGNITSAANSTPIGPDTLLRQESGLSQLPYLSKDVTYLRSSYDPTGGNQDSGNFLSISSKTAVLADMKGPGAVVRIWSASPQHSIKVYIDDNPVPIIDLPFGRLFDNTTPPFVNPIAGQSSGGFYSYFPITYAKHCVITADVGDLFYQINYVTFPAGTAVRPLSLPLTASNQAALDDAKAAWSNLAIPATLPGLTTTRSVLPLQTLALGKYKGPGVITHIRLALPGASDSDLRKIVLRAYFDGHSTPDVEVPVADFFGNAYGRKPFGTLLLAQAADGSFEANFPMPFARTARFTLESGIDHTVQAGWSVDTISAPFSTKTEGYFHAVWRSELTVDGHPHTWIKVTGQRGKLVGIVQAMNGPGLAYLEGDDQIRVDDQTWTRTPKFPATMAGPWNGTGTEDFFNSGWYFATGVNSLPMNGLLVKSSGGKIASYRWFINDSPIFQSSLDAQIEHGDSNNRPGVDYSSVAYYYSDGPMVEQSAFPKAADLHVPEPAKPLFKLPNAIEGETLTDTSHATHGYTAVWGTNGVGKNWSNDAQLIWYDGKINDALTLTFTPPAAGTYDLVAYLTKDAPYGRFTFQVNGKTVGGTFDGYYDHAIPSGPIDLGNVTLPEGASTFAVTIIGKDPSSTDTIFGLDALCLNSPGSKPVELLAANLPKLRVRTSGVNRNRLIEDVNGKPFFMAGWAPQNIVHTIPTSAMNDYFKARRAQGFNMAWVTVPGWLNAQGEDNPVDQRDYAGNYMVLDRSNPSLTPSNLNKAYIASVDAMVVAAQQNGIYLFLNVMNVGGDDKVWPKKGQAECTAWGKFWGDRYAQYTHVNFMLGNDWMPQPQGNWIVQGIKESMSDRLFTVDEGFFNHSGGNANRPNPWWQYKDAGATWVNLWGWYSYEASPASPEHTVYQYSTWLMYTQAAKWGVPIAPTFLIETEYSVPGTSGEGTGIPAEFNTPDAHVLRRQLWSVPLGGGSGWGIIGNYNDWLHDSRTTLNDPVLKYYAGYCKSFFTSRRWDLLAPDYGHAFLTSQMGQPGIHDPSYVSAALAADGSWGAVYYPGVPGSVDRLTLNLSKLRGGRGESTVYWFDPTNGTTKSIPGSPFANSGSRTFTTPGINAAGSMDWVLVAESSGHRR